MTTPGRSPAPRPPRPRPASPEERSAEFAATQQRLKLEAAERRRLAAEASGDDRPARKGRVNPAS